MPAPVPLQPNEPTEIGGYHIAGRLGRGGFGTVYLGQTSSGAHVAIKVLHHLDDARARQKFAEEAELAQRVAAFCTAEVLDVDAGADQPYIVSEYVPGPTLYELVTSGGPRPERRLEQLAVTTLQALEAIHRAGILHRDLKPSNIIMGPEGPVLIDFGIARSVEIPTTIGARPAGSVGYSAPEVITREPPPGVRSDVFSWAATIAFAATGRPPFGSGPTEAIIHAVLDAEPDLAGAPGRLQSIVRTALAKDPGQRRDVDDLLATLMDMPGVSQDDETRTTPRVPTTPLTRDVPQSTLPYPIAMHSAPVIAMDMGLLDDTPVVASADSDGNFLVWDLATGQRIHQLTRFELKRDSQCDTTVRIVNIDDRQIVVAGWTEHVRIFDLATGSLLHEPSLDGGSAQAVCTRGTRPVLATALDLIDVHDLATGEQADLFEIWDYPPWDESGPPTALSYMIQRVAIAEVSGHTVLICHITPSTPLDGGAVWAFDLDRREPLWMPRIVQEADVDLMATVHDGTQVVVVSHGMLRRKTKHDGQRRVLDKSAEPEYRLRAWDLATGDQVGRIDQDSKTRPVTTALATGRLKDRPIIVTAGHDGTVAIQDLETGQIIREPTRHHSQVTALALGQINDVLIGLSGDDRGEIQAWKLLDSTT